MLCRIILYISIIKMCCGILVWRKFWSRGPKIAGNLVPQTIFPLKTLVREWNNGPIMKSTVGATVPVQFGAKESAEYKKIQEHEEIDLNIKAIVQSSSNFSLHC